LKCFSYLYRLLQEIKEIESAGVVPRGDRGVQPSLDQRQTLTQAKTLEVAPEARETEQQVQGGKLTSADFTSRLPPIQLTGNERVDNARRVERRGLEQKLLESGSKKEQELLIKRNTEEQEKRVNFNLTASLFRNLVSQVKGKGEEQGGLGLVPGLLGRLNTTFKNPNFSRTASFPGQIRETALTLNRVLTGQNRVIKGVLEMINETLPEDLDPETFVANKIDQSLRNAFGITKAFEKAGLTSDVLEGMTQEQLDNIDARRLVNSISLTPEEKEEIDAVIEDVLAAPPSEPRRFEALEQRGQQPTGNIEILKNLGVDPDNFEIIGIE